MAYPLDFRQQVFRVKQKEGLTFEQTSERFGIPIRTLFRWKERMDPKTKRNKPATKVDMKALAKDVKDNPDLYQYERARKFGVGQSAIFYALRRLKIGYKKNAVPSQGGPAVAVSVSTGGVPLRVYR
ncbi:IS630 transposase-related protein [Muricauda sp. SCSIO 64092]|uniref:IS630 transposase-related protein n=1 Tax=Allomuricauda sp. SCSIO 64092 TaxID=2908842 RepID=UPI001FF1A087|nr:IS630 transposase-related protein [Muricauda sp. SCSIO 64092]UOY08504.1 IS630 transposase-related protein [Muricauda sp. SCSIO 64092]